MRQGLWKLDVEPVDLPLAEPFVIARAAWEVAHNVVVRVSFQGRRGLGEAQPEARWGETREGVIAQLASVDLDALTSPFDLEAVLELLPAGSARCALDIALHDLAATLAGVSVAELLGAAGRPPPPTSVTIPIAPLEKMIERARAHADYPVLKIKVGFEGDLDAVAAVRGVFSGAIRVDANEGWDVDTARARLEEMERLDVELCEQPISAGDHEALAKVAESTSIPVVADEDARTAADVAALAGTVDGVNVKLGKAGGIREAVKAIAVARAHGMLVMLGCNLESGIAATAGAHVASLVDFVDLDGPLLLARDPFPGVAYERGRLVVPPGPGLGVRENQDDV